MTCRPSGLSSPASSASPPDRKRTGRSSPEASQRNGTGRQPRKPRKRWLNRRFLLSPVASIRTQLPGSP
jgi:hypothetical protein